MRSKVRAMQAFCFLAVSCLFMFNNCSAPSLKTKLDRAVASASIYDKDLLKALSFSKSYADDPLSKSCYCIDCNIDEINSLAQNSCQYIRWGMYPFDHLGDGGRYPDSEFKKIVPNYSSMNLGFTQRFNDAYDIRLKGVIRAAQLRLGENVFFEVTVPERFDDLFRNLNVDPSVTSEMASYLNLNISEIANLSKPFAAVKINPGPGFDIPVLTSTAGKLWHFYMAKKAIDNGSFALFFPVIKDRLSTLSDTESFIQLTRALRKYTKDKFHRDLIIGAESIENLDEPYLGAFREHIQFVKKVIDTDVAQYDNRKGWYAIDNLSKETLCVGQSRLKPDIDLVTKISSMNEQLIGQLCILESGQEKEGVSYNRDYNNDGFVHHHFSENKHKIPVLFELDGCHACRFKSNNPKTLGHKFYENGGDNVVFYKNHGDDNNNTSCYSRVRNGLSTTMQFLSQPAIYRQEFIKYAVLAAADISKDTGINHFFPRPIKVDQNNYWEIRDAEASYAPLGLPSDDIRKVTIPNQQKLVRLCPANENIYSGYKGQDVGLFYRSSQCGDSKAIAESLGVTISAPSCTFNGQSVASGNSVTAYSATTATSPATCNGISEQRTCTNGSLSGSYLNSSCNNAAVSKCGAAANVSVELSPTSGLCSGGTAGVISLVGNNYSWTCSGINGDSLSCSALSLREVRRKTISSFYEIYLHRTYDIKGLNYYDNEISQGRITLSTLEQRIKDSDEAFLVIIYNKYLRREPDALGRDTYLNSLNSGAKSRTQIEADLQYCSANKACK